MDPTDYLLYVGGFDDVPIRLLGRLQELESKYRAKSFLFGGWNGRGIGASAVLRAIAELLKSGRSDPDTREHFGRIIHVDCSLWKNRRAMQRAVAEELNLGHLMPVFDKQDEDDDFRGIDTTSRVEIPSIASEIHASLRNERFLMIFHYGGEEDIDLAEFGIPDPDFGPYALGKLLWTSSGRFQLSERKEKLKSSSASFNIIHFLTIEDSKELTHRSLHEEAVEVIGYTGMDDINPAIVLDCFLYSLFLVDQLHGESSNVDYDWDAHACNYWICDGILQGDRASEVGSALHGVIQMVCNKSYLLWFQEFNGKRERYERWISISSNQLEAQDISTLTSNVSSYFLTFGGDGHLQTPNDMFRLASNLRVLKLCKCSFDFASPPFRFCHNLRFLWLDHCTNTGEEQGAGPCFPNLLVLDIRFTDFVFLAEMVETMKYLKEVNTKGVSWRSLSYAWKKLQDLHKLRVTESLDVITMDTCSFVDMMNLELLDLSGNIHMESLPAMSSAGNLKMLIVDGCSSLEHVALEGAPPLLESFSFDGYGLTEKWIHPIHLPKKEQRPKSRTALVKEARVRRISLKGCARLCNMFLHALPNLEELDLSGTAIKTLDLGAMDVPWLKRLFLLGCEQLRSLLWDGRNPSLKVLHVETRGKTRSMVNCGEKRSYGIEAIMVFTDGRFVWSVIKGLHHASYGSKVHLHISSTAHSQGNITKSIEDIGPSQEGLVLTGPLSYIDIVLNKDIVMCSSLVWDHRQLYPLGVHIEIGEGSHHLESMGENIDFKHFTEFKVKSLHVHDNNSITTIFPGASTFWEYLEWCHVERCSKLHSLFPSWTKHSSFGSIRIFSASDLLMAYCVWARCNGYHRYNFQNLQHIYLHNCPRLVFILPISFTLRDLETIQIAYCRNLQHIFPLNDNNSDAQKIASGVTFEKLKHIKLYHLHKLEQICEVKLTAPMLETISLRDCWALRRLPAVSRQGPKPVVDCEKDWWDRLEWDGPEANHDPSLFETRHSAYYKKTLPRVSVLR
ncbi:uncharacterized protein LOC125525101 [Triticum urartu]|uniref:uncharacterized protein LOC125525101 n=1 Tax=Triticum urartu TaxID=4572 RepID=UPI002044231D|nr:uncharacterized protein LOC125525101 [Triticum urartu]